MSERYFEPQDAQDLVLHLSDLFKYGLFDKIN